MLKINDFFITWLALEQVVPQGSVLSPVLFNIYGNDLFFTLFSVNVCNFADDTTPFVCDLNLEVVFLLKACVHYFSSKFYFSPNDSPSKIMKNPFYLI